jgi:hypothetical protein
MPYTDPTYLLNLLLDDLGEEQDGEEWSTDVVRPGEWFTANHQDGRLVEAWIEHVSTEAIGYDAVTLTR